MQIVAADARRATTTPNGTMTTLASPSIGSAGTALWSVEMNPDAEGPIHAFEDEVLWMVTAGDGVVRSAGEEQGFVAGDTLVLPAGVMRQLTAGPAGFTAIATTPAPGRVTRDDDGTTAVPAWVA